MTEEEYFRKNYPDSCYGDKPLSPYWDFFQDGVEFGERYSEKRIEELENKIADIKANCDLAIEGRDIKIKELKADNDARKFAMAMSEKVEKQLREQIEKMKCCGNCKYSNQESAYSIVCKVGGVDKTDYINTDDNQVCDKWELREIKEND